jgi:transglutaminase-like putative cysteine protease
MTAPPLPRSRPDDRRHDRPPAVAGPGVPGAPRSSSARPPTTPPGMLLAAVIVLLAAAAVPLGRVFIGLDFARPVAAALLLSVGLSWATRRAGGGPLTGLLVSALGFCLLVTVAFLPSTLALGVLPTLETAGAARDLWVRGLELVRVRPAPAFAEDGLLLLAVTGVWWVAHVVEGLVFRLGAPLRAVGMALVLWTVPLAVAPPTARVWAWAVPFLAAAAGLLLLASSTDLGRWGAFVAAAQRPGGRRRNPLVVAGWPVAAVAILAGVVLGGTLPGYGEPPWYEVRGAGGTTLTTNPIVNIRPNLVNLGDEPVARVTSPRPTYLRLTALDVYGDNEEWRSDGIRGGSATGRLPFETSMAFFSEMDVDVEVQGLPGAVIVPVPYHPTVLDGPLARDLQYDRNRATVTLARGSGLDPGVRYSVRAAVPAPPPDLLEASTASAPPSLTALPGSVPPEVVDLARRIVEEAGATTPFAQAFAVQEELRSWEYSLDPPQGHGSSAMRSFIEQRIGYCEQYAGTMAVMLRTLGIPARVAVGYTPGELVDPDAGVYQVRNANAHAWVEVRFDELGWIAFEPTPRTDGNVLVPQPDDVAPALLESQLAEAAAEPEPEPIEVTPQQETPPEPQDPADRPLPDESTGAADGAGDEDGAGRWWLPLLALLGLGGAGAALAARRRPEPTVPAEAVLAALRRVEHLARGLGVPRHASETDAELLSRLAPGSRDAAVLARAAERARWAVVVPVEEAAAARAAARRLDEALLADRGTAARTLLHLRAAGMDVVERVRRRLPSRG